MRRSAGIVMTVKQRQEFRIVLLKRARRVAERKLEVYDDERVARNVRIRSIIARDLDTVCARDYVPRELNNWSL